MACVVEGIYLMQTVTIGDDWFFRDNFVPFLRFVAGRAKYDLLPEEEQAMEMGVRETDREQNRWYDYEFAGANTVRLWFAIDPGSSVVFWRAECPAALRDAIEAAANLMQGYRLVGGPRQRECALTPLSPAADPSSFRGVELQSLS